MSFQEKHSFENRKLESLRIRSKYPDRIPVVIEKANQTDLIEIDKCKFLVPSDLTVSQFIYVIRKRLKLPPEKALFVFIMNTIPPGSALMSTIYEDYKHNDGFVYMQYAGENTFGSTC